MADTALFCEHCHDRVVELRDVTFQYQSKRVLEKLSFDILQRDFVCLAGSNGAGKTTLLRLIVGLQKPEQGTIRLFGQPIERFREWHRIGYVPQKNSLNPLFPATVREVVQSGLYGRKTLFRRLPAGDLPKVNDALEAMSISELAGRRIGELSGGQQQRVLLARALVRSPELLILDEPTVGIDAETQESFFQMIRHMHEHHPITFLMVTHDMEAIRSYVGGMPSMESGKLKLFVKHSHSPEDCRKPGLTHSIADKQAAAIS